MMCCLSVLNCAHVLSVCTVFDFLSTLAPHTPGVATYNSGILQK